jgi:pilus assembly protein TadC
VTAFAAGVCLALAAYLFARPSPPIERLGLPPRVRMPRAARTLTPRAGLVAGAGLAGCLVLAGFGWPGVAIGVVAGLGLRALLRRAEPRAVSEVREAVGSELPWVLDLLAATIAAGTAPTAGLEAVAAVLARSGSLTGARLTGVAARLRLGAALGEAWAPALADGGDALAPVAEAFAAATADGSHLAARLAGLAQAAREIQATEALAAAERAGVRAVLPLGLCYLPAFVLVGIVPIVASALHRI